MKCLNFDLLNKFHMTDSIFGLCNGADLLIVTLPYAVLGFMG